MATIRKRGKTCYVDYYEDGGKRVVKAVSKDKSAAEVVRKEIEIRKHLGEIPKPKANILIRNAAAKYYEAMGGVRRPKTIHSSKGRL
ncbi:MAG: hypothetical protein JSW64_10840 [Candidatus Zixiibacteriota bacterium]|nr:MAG: hypothetical protein JSW64_10840 [candidate division Zixibacteria bacterium]